MLHPKPTPGTTDWFVHDRFGMFVHWGLYALPARHEWVQSQERLAPEDYRRYFERFNPDQYDPAQWAGAAKAAGMKYVVITSKHHEGFCLWDTRQTDYKVTNTPYGKDVLGPFVEAFRAAGLKIGFYYSLLDWHHPDFTIDIHHPLRDDPDVAGLNAGRDMARYAAYMREQVRELLTFFGKIDLLWCDFSYPDREYKGLPGKGRDDWHSDELYSLIRSLQPEIVLNNRLDLPPELADLHTPEQWQPTRWVHVNGEPVVWEACQTFSGSWGYHRDETTWKSPGQLIRLLGHTVSIGGNVLMNVGPTARGTLDRRALDALGVYRDWMALHADSIYGCTQSEYTAPPDCRLTQNGRRLFVHIFAYPFRFLYLDGLAGKVEYAQFLHDGSEILFRDNPHFQRLDAPEDALVLELPVREPDVIVPVIELTLK
jgi:alpha-L-fucosidase